MVRATTPFVLAAQSIWSTRRRNAPRFSRRRHCRTSRRLRTGNNLEPKKVTMAASCPNCGFSYAWDGTMCSHCHDPSAAQMDRDELIEKRFVFKAKKNGLPSKRTWLFHDLPVDMLQVIGHAAGDLLRGKPVLAFIDSPARWTLLTTRQVLSWYDNHLHHVLIDEMISVRSHAFPGAGATSEEIAHYKVTWEYLRLVQCEGTTLVWVPCGEEAFALWNLLLPFVRSKIRSLKTNP